MRLLRALAVAAMLTVSTSTVVFAGQGGDYAQPARPEGEAVQGQGGDYSVQTEPNDIRYGEFWA